jgi:hypothetical protein
MVFCEKYPGGTEVEMTLLFVDVRGSTSLAEEMSARNYSRLMNRFYKAATNILIRTDAFIDQFVGDEAVGLYFPLFTGPNHARAAVSGAQELLHAMGYGDRGEPLALVSTRASFSSVQSADLKAASLMLLPWVIMLIPLHESHPRLDQVRP